MQNRCARARPCAGVPTGVFGGLRFVYPPYEALLQSCKGQPTPGIISRMQTDSSQQSERLSGTIERVTFH
ncbi:MAG: hypothetical protein ACREX4_16270, partial [Gammaproteobacteria bacterium]